MWLHLKAVDYAEGDGMPLSVVVVVVVVVKAMFFPVHLHS